MRTWALLAFIAFLLSSCSSQTTPKPPVSAVERQATVDRIVRLSADPMASNQEKRAALKQLEEAGAPPAAVQALLGIVKNNGCSAQKCAFENYLVQHDAFRMLGKTGSAAKDALPYLLEYVRSVDYEDWSRPLPLAATEAILRIAPAHPEGPSLLEAALNAAKDWDRFSRLALMINCFYPGSDIGRTTFLSLLKSDDKKMRLNALVWAAFLYGQSAVPEIAPALKAPSTKVRYTAIAALKQIDTPNARSELKEYFRWHPIDVLRGPLEIVEGAALAVTAPVVLLVAGPVGVPMSLFAYARPDEEGHYSAMDYIMPIVVGVPAGVLAGVVTAAVSPIYGLSYVGVGAADTMTLGAFHVGDPEAVSELTVPAPSWWAPAVAHRIDFLRQVSCEKGGITDMTIPYPLP